MKFLVVLAVAVACVSADVAYVNKDEAAAPILKSSFESEPSGSFQYSQETGNGILSQASGVVKNPNSDAPTLEVTGGFKYVAPDGSTVEETYVANENGFQPQGSHIPVPPAIPEAIVRGLAYIAAHPPPAEGTVVKPGQFSG